MIIASLAGDGDGLALLGRVVSLTLFYAALSWLPLRGTAAVVERVQTLKHQRRRKPPPKPLKTSSTWVIR